jgi:calcium homeostasis ER protein
VGSTKAILTAGSSLCQATLINEYSAVVQPVQLAFQQQIQTLKTQHEDFVSSLAQQQQLPQMEAEVKATPPPPAPPPAPAPAPAMPPTTQPGRRLSVVQF